MQLGPRALRTVGVPHRSASIGLARGVSRRGVVYPTVEIASASLKLPAYNRIAGGPGISYLKQSIANFPGFFVSSGTTVGDGMLFLKLKMPFERRAGLYQTRIMGSGGTTGSRFLLSYYGPRHVTTARRNRFVLEGGPNAAGTTAGMTSFALVSADVPRDCKAGLFLFSRRVGAAVSLDMIRLDTLQHIPGPPITDMTSAQNAHQIFYVGDSSSTDPAATIAQTVAAQAFDGEISEIGYYNGTVSDANAIAIAGGAPIETVLTPANVKYLRRLVGTDATSMAPVAGTGDTTASLTATGAFEKGSTIGRQATARYLTIDQGAKEGMVWPIMPGGRTAEVRLSGRATGAAVHACAIRKVDGALVAGWQDVATVAGGQWEGAFEVPADVGEIVVEVRDRDDQTLRCLDRTRQAIGIKVLLVGQSPLQIALHSSTLNTGFTGTGFASISRFENGDVANQPETHILCGLTRSDAIHQLAKEFQRRSGLPIQVVSGAVSGTTHFSLMYDAAGDGREWSDLVEMLDHAGRRFSVVYHNWGNSDYDQGAKFGPACLAPILFGAQPDLASNAVIGGVTYGAGSPPPAPEHYLTDGDIEGNFAIVVSPVTRATDGLAANYDAVRNKTLEYIAATPGVVRGPNVDLMRTGGFSGPSSASPHQDETVAMGNPYLGAYLAEGVLRGIGRSSLQDPSLGAAVFTDGTKSVIRVAAVLPNGGSLKTRDDATWAANVKGFEVSDNGGATWTAFAGTISGPNTVDIPKSSGSWAGGGQTLVRYLYGDPIDTASAGEEGATPTHGALFESSPRVWEDVSGGDLGLSVTKMLATAVA